MTKCILQDYRTDKCEGCDGLCPHYIVFHGRNGKGGKTASARIPKDYRDVTFLTTPVRNSQADAYRALDAYVKTFKRHLTGGERAKSLYLWSRSPGTGKTTTAVALLNAWMSVSYLIAMQGGNTPSQGSAYFLDINELQARYNIATMTRDEDEIQRIGATIKRLQSAEFAVLDDIGVRASTEAFTAYVHAIINARTSAGLPTIYTSNLPMDEMSDVFTERLYDRIRDQCLAIHFDGESKRGRR